MAARKAVLCALAFFIVASLVSMAFLRAKSEKSADEGHQAAKEFSFMNVDRGNSEPHNVGTANSRAKKYRTSIVSEFCEKLHTVYMEPN